MFLFSNKIVFVLLCFLCIVVSYEKKTYFVFERAITKYYDPEYLNYVTISTRRYGRADPMYYFNVAFYAKDYFGNNVHFFFDFYEYLSNAYKRSFVQISGNMCNILKNPAVGAMIGPAFYRNLPRNTTCPFPPGEYKLENMTMIGIPHFPFQKGRVFGNLTYVPKNTTLFYGSVDFKLKDIKVKQKN